jgi:hypothetical protein
MPGAWKVDPDTNEAIYLTDDGDGIELAELYDSEAPASLRVPAREALHEMILAAEVQRNCRCGYGGVHEPENPSCPAYVRPEDRPAEA